LTVRLTFGRVLQIFSANDGLPYITVYMSFIRKYNFSI